VIALQLTRIFGSRDCYVPITVRIDTLRDGARDDTLARPLLLAADGHRVYYCDYGDGRLSAIDTTGRLLWRAGRRGQGPDEWANPTSILAVQGGGVAVVDGASARFTRVDANGRFTRLVTTVDIPQRLARGSGSTLIAFAGQNLRPAATLLDSAFKRDWERDGREYGDGPNLSATAIDALRFRRRWSRRPTTSAARTSCW